MKKDLDLSRRTFMKIASVLGVGAAGCPLSALMLPESALAADMVPLRLYSPHLQKGYNVELFVGQQWNENALLVCHYLMKDWRKNILVPCDRKLYAALYVIQRKFGIPDPINIFSGYRSAETNAMLRQQSIARNGGRATAESPAVNSQHIQAKAVDFMLPGVPPLTVSKYVQTLGLGGTGNYSTFTHMDTRGEPARWGRGL
jgi:uncharacterized protein YcbK (DUF882 family)